jgi:hypothetical protein
MNARSSPTSAFDDILGEGQKNRDGRVCRMLKCRQLTVVACTAMYLSACEGHDARTVEYCQFDSSSTNTSETNKRVFFVSSDEIGGSDLLMQYTPIELPDGHAITSPYPIFLPSIGAPPTAGTKRVEDVEFFFEQISADDNLWYVKGKFSDVDASVFGRGSIVYIYSATEGIIFFEAVDVLLPDGQLISHSFRRCDEKLAGLRSF